MKCFHSCSDLGLVALSSLLIACSTPNDGPDERDVVDADFIAMDGVQLHRSNNSIFLVDSNTGNTSARAWSTLPYGDHNRAIGGMRAVASPCGRYVAYILPEREGIALMEFAWDDGLPTLHEVRRWEVDLHGQELGIHFNYTGDRIYTRRVWIDRDSDRIIDCGEDELKRLPGPYRFYCHTSNVNVYYEDFDPHDFPLGAVAQRFSADLQWFGPQVHVPSGTTIPYLGIEGQMTAGDYRWPWNSASRDPLYSTPNGTDVNFNLPDNRNVIVQSSWNGIRQFEVSAGWANVCDQDSSADLPIPPRHYGTFEHAHINLDLYLLEDGEVDAVSETLLDRLTPFFELYDMVQWSPLGVIPNMDAGYDEYVFRVMAWDRNESISHVGLNCSMDLKMGSLLSISSDGTLLRSVEVTESVARLMEDSQREIFRMGTDDFLIANHLIVFGFRGDEFIHWTDVTTAFDLTEDRMYFAPPFDIVGTEKICLRRAAFGQPMRCMPNPSTGRMVGIVGQGQHPLFPTPVPVINAVSSESIHTGGEVVITGAAFGESGTLWIGDVEVPRANILSWTPHQIRLHATDSLPRQGQLGVETPSGRSHQELAFWFHRTDLTSLGL